MSSKPASIASPTKRRKRSKGSSSGGGGKDADGKGNKPKNSKATVEENSWDRTRANMKTIIGAILLAIVIRIVLVEAFEIEGPSMEPTLLNGDRVVVAKFQYGLFLPGADRAVWTWSHPNPGDVVIVRNPQDGIDIVKRVIGVGGDTIEIRDDVVYRNGNSLGDNEVGVCQQAEGSMVGYGDDCRWVGHQVGDRPFQTSRSDASAPQSHPPVAVPHGSVFVLGDHRDRSNDSRNLGPIDVGLVKGRALGIYWSCGDPTVEQEDQVPGFTRSFFCSSPRWDRIFSGI